MCGLLGRLLRHSSTAAGVTRPRRAWLAVLVCCSSCSSSSAPSAPAPTSGVPQPQIVAINGGPYPLEGYLWEPAGRGPFPMVLYNHGSEKDPGSKPVLGTYFTGRGYGFLVPHRRGQGLSPGPYISDLIAQAPPNQQNQ